MMENSSFTENTLHNIAYDYYYATTDVKEIAQVNMTNVFYQELDLMIRNGEIIKIQINGKPRLGKSTVGAALGTTIYSLLGKDGSFGIRNIARDQREFMKMMQNPSYTQTVIVADEFNEMESGGENVTAETSLLAMFSDIQAARYVHTILISPEGVHDKNTDIILRVRARNDAYVTRCDLYYKLSTVDFSHPQLLGYVDIPVQNILLNWETKVKKVFEIVHKTEAQKKFIIDAASKDYWVHYQIRKHQKIDLVTKHNILRPKELDQSPYVLLAVENLKKLAILPRLLTTDIIENEIERIYRQEGVPHTILGLREETRRTKGILDRFKSLHLMQAEKDKLLKAYSKNHSVLLKDKIDLIGDSIILTREHLASRLEELRHLKSLKEQFESELYDLKIWEKVAL